MPDSCALLENIAGFKVVAEAQNGHEAWKLIRRLRPALALVDISMPVLDGLELTARVAAKYPQPESSCCRCTQLEITSNERSGRGRRATCSKTPAPPSWSGPSAPSIAARPISISQPVVTLRQSLAVNGGEAVGLDVLTPRQREILQLIGEGYSTKAIANLLGISFKTAEAHRSNLRERLGLHDVAAVVRFAIAAGLVNPDHRRAESVPEKPLGPGYPVPHDR